MKIEKIRLENFRVYYGEQVIEFSTSEEKNLTLILAKNNAGKTTLAQSIIWCLYDYMNLKEPDEVLNKEVKYNMNDGETRIAAVTLEIIHRGQKLIIRREKEVTKIRTGYSSNPSKLTIMAFNDKNQIVDASNDIDINEVLPRSLSRFFIFDGERMLHLGRNDNVHRDELEKDIRNILGLDALEEAIKHLGGWNNNGGVLLSLANQIDNSNDDEIKSVQESITDLSETITDIESQIEQNNQLQKEKQLELEKLSEFLEANKHVEQKQLERKQLESELKSLIERKEKLKGQYLRKSSEALPQLFLQKLFDRTISFVTSCTDLVEATPEVTSATIDYILEKKECICGTKFGNDDEIYRHLEKSKKFYPPESIGTSTKRYIDAVKNAVKKNEDTLTALEENYSEYLDIDATIHGINGKLDAINRGFQASTEEQVRKANESYVELTNEMKDLEETLSELKVLKRERIKDLEEKQAELDKLSQTSVQNNKILKYREVTKEILELLKTTYNLEEEKVRNDLRREVQKVYSEINRGIGKLDISKKFDFTIYTEINGKTIKDDTKGQGLSTVAAFSFVCGITKLVREKMGDDLLYRNEPYPLVIDAPYSVMDTGYIESVSKILPSYAQQLIILVKDDNFETARKVFSENNVIGKEYVVELENNNGIENQLRTKIKNISS